MFGTTAFIIVMLLFTLTIIMVNCKDRKTKHIKD